METWHGFLDRQLQLRPDAAAFSDTKGVALTYAALSQACDDIAAHLATAGVRPGDRVVILSENCCAAVAALFACSRLRAVAVPVNARMSADEVARILAHAEPAAVLATTGVSPEARGHAARLAAHEISGSWGQLHLATPFASAPVAQPDLAVILYTTGTTGDPKGVMLSHGNLCFGGRASAELRGMTAEDVIYGVLPITHVFGLASVVTAALCAGAEVRLEARFDAGRLHAALLQGVTLLSAVPQMHALVMQYARERGLHQLGSRHLRYVSSGAAPLDPDWKRRAEAFYGVALQNGYGMTEATAGICATRSEIGDPDTSVGPPLPGVQLRLDHAVTGCDSDNGLGEVLLRGGNVMMGYFRNPGETARVLDSAGWLRSGDLGRLDAAGRLHIDGRCKELIIRGGFNIFPPEVEAALNAHPGVVQAAVVGRAITGDEEVLAFVQVPGSGPVPTEAELQAFVSERLVRYKCPSRIILTDALPAAATGKILKHKLLAHFAKELTQAS